MAAQQLRFFRKNFADYEKTGVSATASEAPTLAGQALQRSNRTGWGTTGSVDANNTTFTVTMTDTVSIDSILLIGHNWKNYQIKYLDPSTGLYVAFTPDLHPTTSTDSTTFWNSFGTVVTSGIQITIFGTQVANSDKVLNQIILTSSLGQLTGWPIIQDPTLAVNLTELPSLSGKSMIVQNVGKYSVSLAVSNWSNSADLAIVESIFGSPEGFLFWPCGGDENQFSSVRQGYRLRDIYLVRCNNEYTPGFVEGLYKAGMDIQIDLVEVIT